MKKLSIGSKVALAFASAAVVTGGAYAVVNLASAPASSTTPAQSTIASKHHFKQREHGFARLFDRAEQGSATIYRVRQGVTVDWYFVRGTVTALSGSSVTVKEPSGSVVSASISSSTRVRGIPVSVAMSKVSSGSLKAILIEKNGSLVMLRLHEGPLAGSSASTTAPTAVS
jgi:hypothetical protein